MISLPDKTTATVLEAISTPAVFAFFKENITKGYTAYFSDQLPRVEAMLAVVFTQLAQMQNNAAALKETTHYLQQNIFNIEDPHHWFQAGYAHYRTHIKPQYEYKLLQPHLNGKTILDFGCGQGHLATILHQHGYQPYLTDLYDKRAPLPQTMPFYLMKNGTDISTLPTVDIVVVKTVLHHVHTTDLAPILLGLNQISQRLILLEDVYGLDEVPTTAVSPYHDPTLWPPYVALTPHQQYLFLALLDYFANEITFGLPMDLPFNFKTVPEWETVLATYNWQLTATIWAGFATPKVHRTHQAWLICDHLSPPI